MTEADWFSCTAPAPMLEYLRVKASGRKLRLFAVACCRHIWHLFKDDNNRRAVEVAERLADGLATNAERRAAARAVGGGAAGCAVRVPSFLAAEVTSHTAAGVFATASESPLLSDGQMNPAWYRLVNVERAAQAHLLRDIFNPWAPALAPAVLAWDGGTVPKLARAIYDARDFDNLPILADALEEAGCSDPAILSHCRSPGPHTRGCEVVDLILGRK